MSPLGPRPELDRRSESELLKRLLVNAGKGSFDFISLENYE
jgi:hypothetical protein